MLVATLPSSCLPTSSGTQFGDGGIRPGEWSVSRPGRALPPGNRPPIPIGQEAGWASEPVWTQRLEEKSFASVGDRTPVVQSVVRHYISDAENPRLRMRRSYTSPPPGVSMACSGTPLPFTFTYLSVMRDKSERQIFFFVTYLWRRREILGILRDFLCVKNGKQVLETDFSLHCLFLKNGRQIFHISRDFHFHYQYLLLRNDR
jgi:hypothetical protein